MGNAEHKFTVPSSRSKSYILFLGLPGPSLRLLQQKGILVHYRQGFQVN